MFNVTQLNDVNYRSSFADNDIASLAARYNVSSLFDMRQNFSGEDSLL